MDRADELQRWERWNSHGGPKYPNDQVVRFLFRRFASEQRRNLRVLDLGCGSGVHTVFLAREGCLVTGVDISPTGIANACGRLDAEGLTANLVVAAADAIAFGESAFDVVVSVGLLDSAGPAVSAEAVRRACCMLASGGVALFLFASSVDSRVVVGTEYGLHGYDRSEVDALFASCAASVHVDRAHITYSGGSVIQDEWIVTLVK